MYCRADGIGSIIFVVAENKVVVNNILSLTQILVTISKGINIFISKCFFFLGNFLNIFYNYLR